MDIINPTKNQKDFLFTKIGMALVSTQRVENIVKEILNLLKDYDRAFFNLTTEEFLDKTSKSRKSKHTLGSVFHLLKLSPNIVLEEELDNYLLMRNTFIHEFNSIYLVNSKILPQAAIDYCYEFGILSNKFDSFFKGLYYLMAVKLKCDDNRFNLGNIAAWKNDFNYFENCLEASKII